MQARKRETRKTVRQGNEENCETGGTRKTAWKTVKGRVRKTVKQGCRENGKTVIGIEITMAQE